MTSNVVELNVKPARKLSSVTIQTDLEKNGIGIGSAYESDLKKDVTVTALDQYGESYDWTKKHVLWVESILRWPAGIHCWACKGSDTLQARQVKGHMKPNTINFNVIAKP